jgi:hypothetical protein
MMMMMMMMFMIMMSSSCRILQNSVVAHLVTNFKIIVWNWKFRWRVYKMPPAAPARSKFNPQQLGPEVFLSASRDTNG